jgi:hypothetical protein
MKRLAAGMLVCVLAGTGCQSPPAGRGPWGFDAEAYFNAESLRLARAGTALRKTVGEGEKTESKTIRTPGWEKELRPFLACGIGQAAWRNSYRVDSARQGETLTVTWTATEKAPPVSLLTITFRDDRPVLVTAEKSTGNLYADAAIRFRYVADSGFLIESVQKVIFKKAHLIRVEGLFLGADEPVAGK